mmetsp:Transcript_18136/g.68743  ORF Transcript_18136/g.68743 Transcript_18136/m.68743 type:complete len:257 (+) Transcript_18136:554-1324(+)
MGALGALCGRALLLLFLRRLHGRVVQEGLVQHGEQAAHLLAPEAGTGQQLCFVGPQDALQRAKGRCQRLRIRLVDAPHLGDGVAEDGEVVVVHLAEDGVGRLVLVRLERLQVASGFQGGPREQQRAIVQQRQLVQLAERLLIVRHVHQTQQNSEAEGAAELSQAPHHVLRVQQMVSHTQEQRAGLCAHHEVRHDALHDRGRHVPQVLQHGIAALPPVDEQLVRRHIRRGHSLCFRLRQEDVFSLFGGSAPSQQSSR